MARRQIKRVLVTGSEGQIGTELTAALRRRYGAGNVVASDVKLDPARKTQHEGPFELCDVTDAAALRAACAKHGVDTIVHLAAILSATGEKNPLRPGTSTSPASSTCSSSPAKMGLNQVLCPSSIAVFGSGCPRVDTPQDTVLRPSTMYGVTKVAGELLCDYYVRRFGVDARGPAIPASSRPRRCPAEARRTTPSTSSTRRSRNGRTRASSGKTRGFR